MSRNTLFLINMAIIQEQLSEIRNLVMTHLGSMLGQYTRTDGSKIPAIQIVPVKIPDNWQVTGVECIIEDPLETKPTKMLNSRVRITREITVRFVQRDTTKTLRDIRNKALLLFSRYEEVTSPLYTLPQGLVTLEEVTYRIKISTLEKII